MCNSNSVESSTVLERLDWGNGSYNLTRSSEIINITSKMYFFERRWNNSKHNQASADSQQTVLAMCAIM